MDIRKTVIVAEDIQAEGGERAMRPIRRAAGLAIVTNPYAGRFVKDLTPLFDIGMDLGNLLTKRLVDMLGAPPVSYGKAAIVGLNGEMEHGAACVHPKLGKPMREAVGGGQAVGARQRPLVRGGKRLRRAAILGLQREAAHQALQVGQGQAAPGLGAGRGRAHGDGNEQVDSV